MNTLKNRSLLPTIAFGAILVSLTACSEKPKAQINTLETAKAQTAVNAYDATGSKELKMESEKAFIALDQEIKELEIRVANTSGEKRTEAAEKLAQLKMRESEIRGDFNAAKFNTLIQDIKNSVR
jgi:hypothetical protein